MTTRDVLPLDFANPQHRALMFDLAYENRKKILNDHDNDLVMIINYHEGKSRAGKMFGFIAVVDDEPVGCFWVDIDDYDIGRVRGALFNPYKSLWNGAYYMRWVTDYAFNTLKLRKLEAEFTLYRKNDRESATAERLLKRIGFKKVGICRQAILIDGKPNDTILLDYLQEEYNRGLYKKQKKQHARTEST